MTLPTYTYSTGTFLQLFLPASGKRAAQKNLLTVNKGQHAKKIVQFKILAKCLTKYELRDQRIFLAQFLFDKKNNLICD